MEQWMSLVCLKPYSLLIAIVLLFFYITIYYYNKYKNYPSGPYGLPLVGYLPFINPLKPYETLQKLAIKYGSIYSLRLGTVDAVVLSDARLIREFFKHEELTARAPLFLTHGIMGGYGIICAEGELWKNQRRHVIEWLKQLGMTKTAPERRAELEKRIMKGVKECLQDFQAAADKKGKAAAFDELPIVQHTLGNIINDLVFGVTYKRDDPVWKYFQKLQEEGVKLIGISGVVNFLPFLRFLPSNKRTINFLLNGKAETHRIYAFITELCKHQLADRKILPNEKLHSILEYFLSERDRKSRSNDAKIKEDVEKFYNDEQLKHLLADLFGAGVDTSLATLRWFLLYMAKNRKFQIELIKKIKALLPYNLSLKTLEATDYLRACISETQRIRTVVPLGIPHGTNCAINIEGYRLPKNCMVIPLLHAVHMNPNYWPDPEKFNPERFLNKETGAYEQPQQFLPFQSGKRMCMGEDLARMILYSYAGFIFSKFKVRLSPESEKDMAHMEGECGITWSPKPYKLIVEAI